MSKISKIILGIFILCLIIGTSYLWQLGANRNQPSAHIYGHPDTSIKNVRVVTYYAVPSDRVPLTEQVWQPRLTQYMTRITNFHNQQFSNFSTASYKLAPTAIRLDKTSKELRDSDYFNYICKQAAARDKRPAEAFSTYLIFADWGMKDNTRDNCAIPYCTEGTDRLTYQQCGGDGGAYIENPTRNKTYGCGIVSESTWKGSKPGVTSVMYHEGLGHPLNMPHSAPPATDGVMGLAGWYCRDVENAILEPEIRRSMTP